MVSMIRSYNNKAPEIAETAYVSEAAYIIGDIKIGKNSSIWPGAVIRADFARIEIGDNTQIEDNCVLHAGNLMVIGNNVHVGHGAVVHCSKVGDNVLIGMNASILDGAEIGNFCVIGANSVVVEGMKIPDNSFVVGVPAKIKGKTSEDLINMIEVGVREYVKKAKEYKDAGL